MSGKLAAPVPMHRQIGKAMPEAKRYILHWLGGCEESWYGLGVVVWAAHHRNMLQLST
jgi:hypothetical protein